MRSNIKLARDKVEFLRLALLSPSPVEIGAALPGLEDAVFCLGTVERELRGGACAPYEARRELQMLKNDLKIVSRLIANGVAFCRGWARITGAGPAYTPAGVRAPAHSQGSLSLRG